MKLEKILRPIGKFCGALALATSLAAAPSFASEEYDQPNKNKNEIYQEVVLGNCVLQGVIAGFGGMQNKKPYWESFAKGCLGGVLVAGGKIAVGNDLNNAWPAKLATATGTSISYNASNGKPIFDSLGIDFGPAFFELKKNEFGNYKFKTYLLPDSLAAYLLGISEGDKIDWDSSLKYGTPILISNKIMYPGQDFSVTMTNNIRILNENEYANDLECERNIDCTDKRHPRYLSEKEVEKEREKTLRHELIHTHQYTSTRTLGNVLLNRLESLKGFNGVEMELKARLLEPFHINLDHGVGYYLYTLAFMRDEDSLGQREAYRLSNGEKKTN